MRLMALMLKIKSEADLRACARVAARLYPQASWMWLTSQPEATLRHTLGLYQSLTVTPSSVASLLAQWLRVILSLRADRSAGGEG